MVVSVRVISDDLPRGVDALRNGKVVAGGIVNSREGGAAVGVIEEAVRAAGVVVTPHDLARTIDAVGGGTLGAQGVVEGGVSSAAVGVVEEAVARAIDGCFVIPDDLAYAVDAVGEVTQGITQWIVDSGVVSGRVEETWIAGLGVV